MDAVKGNRGESSRKYSEKRKTRGSIQKPRLRSLTLSKTVKIASKPVGGAGVGTRSKRDPLNGYPDISYNQCINCRQAEINDKINPMHVEKTKPWEDYSVAELQGIAVGLKPCEKCQ